MRFALLGDHPAGVAFARALASSGRHSIVAARGVSFAGARLASDLEELLADPAVEACIVAVPVRERLEVARRVLQSERPAAVVHPVALKPDGAYELAMLQGDTHQALLPLITEHLDVDESPAQLDGIFELTVSGERVSLEPVGGRENPALFGWTLLRRHGGELAEVLAFAESDDVDESKPLVVMGRFERGGLFQVTYLPGGPAGGHDGPWDTVVEEFEAEVAFFASVKRAEPSAGAKDRPGARLGWIDEVRALELDDAAARSLSKRRSTLMEYQEASEEVGFKGTMTLVGCGILWSAVMLLILSAWVPWLGWVILPVILLFLAMQALGWLTRERS